MNKKSYNVLAIVGVLLTIIGNINAISSGKNDKKINLAQTSIPWYIGFYTKKGAEVQSSKMLNQWGLTTKIGLNRQKDHQDVWQVFIEPVQDDEGTGLFILRKGFTSEEDAISYSDDLKRSLALSNEIIKRGNGTFWVVFGQAQNVWPEKTTAANATVPKTTDTKTIAAYAVSVGSFSIRSDAEKHVIDMERRYGQTCEIKETVLDNGRRTYRVAAYFTNNENDAKQYAIFWRRQIKSSDDDKKAAFAFDLETGIIL